MAFQVEPGGLDGISLASTVEKAGGEPDNQAGGAVHHLIPLVEVGPSSFVRSVLLLLAIGGNRGSRYGRTT